MIRKKPDWQESPGRGIVCPTMPDRGFWTLRCQSCRETFTIELLPGQRIVDFATDYECPHCHKKPEDSSASATSWHRIIDYHIKR